MVGRLRTEAGRRALGIGLTLLVEALLLLLLLSLGTGERFGIKEGRITVVSLAGEEAPEQAPEPKQQQAEQRPVPQLPAKVEPPQPQPKAALTERAVPPPQPERQPPAITPSSTVQPAPSGRVYGPPAPGRRSASSDTERVGTAPNGEPLYAAAWYRKPTDNELRGYMSTADGPGWGLIACRTAPNYRVEDCVGLDEYPDGSQINRAVLAAAWQFLVRPPQKGGVSLVGSWVRIRIDYSIDRH